MNYTPLDEYSRKWIFTHQSIPVSSDDLEQIKPLTQARSAQLWREHISNQSPDAERLLREDWASVESNWVESVDWQACWDSDDIELPEEVLDFIDWEDDVTVFFCYEKYNIIETKWGVFKRCWKNFLFFDDLPFLIGKRKAQAVWFSSDGMAKLGQRK